MAFLKFIAIFFIIFYAVRFLLRLVMPFALRKVSERLMRTAQQHASASAGQNRHANQDPFSQFRQQTQPKDEGEIHVHYIPGVDTKPRKGTGKAGEFIDFEEVK
ncbi:MAG: DUF4834 family protein [Sphingobacterium sp.]|uniref:DUF4834 family protein n=1 Tax=Sphingobacterium sp. JB170 TaxID=1434842 RepID=UPI00097EF963|nr:DUF4834 family protein [Sphingobacterium sp. JB170]SJN32889.1 hypothetical protein FM107_07545 [Sphingobacterium sp. JB170]